MPINNTAYKNKYYFIAGYFILWVVLFEFILPANSVLPKPSIVIESFGDLWNENIYNLPDNFLSTIAAVYIPIIVSYFLTKWLSNTIIKEENVLTGFFFSLDWFSKYIPGIVLGILLIYWFPVSELIEFVFAFGTAFFSMLIKVQNLERNISKEYVDASLSLGINKNKIERKVEWKLMQPEFIKHLFELHFYLWTMLIAFEYIKGGFGLGALFREALQYKDISAIFSLFLITGITIYFGSEIIKYISRKFVFWRIS